MDICVADVEPPPTRILSSFFSYAPAAPARSKRTITTHELTPVITLVSSRASMRPNDGRCVQIKSGLYAVIPVKTGIQTSLRFQESLSADFHQIRLSDLSERKSIALIDRDAIK